MKPIFLLSDFGLKDIYVGAVKAVISAISPHSGIYDLCHEIPPQDVKQGALALAGVEDFLPEESITIAVVDPEVGSAREALCLMSDSRVFIAPNNGLLSYLKAFDKIDALYKLKVPAKSSSTFHARDIFAPYAAKLSAGINVNDWSDKLDISKLIKLPKPYLRQNEIGEIEGEILNIDNFGNIITSFKSSDLKNSHFFEINNIIIEKRGLSYFSADGIVPMYLESSFGYIEIAINSGSAADIIKAKIGDKIIYKSINKDEI